MTATTTQVSPLLDEHEILGASFTDFAGWQMPVKYGSELAEHHAVRQSAGLFDISHMGEILVEGPGAAAALDHALVGELSKVAVGRAKYSLMCDASGGVLDDLVTYRLADERFLVVANAANTATVVAELTGRARHFDARVTDQSARYALIAVQGPAARDIVEAVVRHAGTDRGDTVDALKYYAVTTADVAGIDVLLARTGYTGEDGFELYVARADAVRLWRVLLDATTARGGAAAGLACRDTLRLEAGMPLYGHELSTGTTPYEAGLGKLVRLSKDFVGRDALAAIAERPPARTLVGLTGTGRRAARAGYRVHARDEAGTAVGVVTSGALSPTLGYPVAMAYVATEFAHPGIELAVDLRGRKELFQITALPFYRRP
ncbi:glycine cleavage system aminomethyltransferase GcvT [Mycolicibacterium sp.]|uniref:glycine cleavage system aminomethyltransferase GcvT n=1 Tax=Mycolicibacterium sp. TaxID=2320850 RepID=UPI003D0DC82B